MGLSGVLWFSGRFELIHFVDSQIFDLQRRSNNNNPAFQAGKKTEQKTTSKRSNEGEFVGNNFWIHIH